MQRPRAKQWTGLRVSLGRGLRDSERTGSLCKDPQNHLTWTLEDLATNQREYAGWTETPTIYVIHVLLSPH